MSNLQWVTALNLPNSKCFKYLDNDFVYHMHMVTLDIPYNLFMGNVHVYFSIESDINNNDYIVIESGDCNYYAKFPCELALHDLLVQIIDTLDNLIDRNEDYFN